MTVCSDIWSRIHCKSVITLCYRPKDAALAVTIFHVLMGVRKGDPNNRWTKASKVVVVLQTATVSEAATSPMSRGVTGPISSRAALSSTMVRASTYYTVSQSTWTSTVVGGGPQADVSGEG